MLPDSALFKLCAYLDTPWHLASTSRRARHIYASWRLRHCLDGHPAIIFPHEYLYIRTNLPLFYIYIIIVTPSSNLELIDVDTVRVITSYFPALHGLSCIDGLALCHVNKAQLRALAPFTVTHYTRY
jgi:hypothetical protein